MGRKTLQLKVISSHSTECKNETRWIFEDENKQRFEWYTTSGRILIKGKCYVFNSEIVMQLHGNFLYNPRGFREIK